MKKGDNQGAFWRRLLKRYMAHVMEHEGISYVEWLDSPHTTENDIKILRQLQEEIKNGDML